MVGFSEILSKVPGISFNIGTKVTNIHITNSGVLVNGKDQGSIARQAILDNINSGKDDDSYPCDILHEDLLGDYKSLEEIINKEKDLLKILKKVLPENRFEMILMARRVHFAIEKNEGSQKIIALVSKLDGDFPRDGKKVLNLFSADYFNSTIFPLIESFKEHDPDSYVEKSNDLFESILRFFPIAIFVNNNTSVGKISEELRKRLGLKKIPFIKIHAIGLDNISKVETALLDLKDIRFSIEDNRFTTSRGIAAQMVKIKFNYN
ncbi:MAG: hypothetical protein KKF50_04035 [Nanoarchaeota archaeon]|nr:hypothetical protein [Nanoarchaeota archaeon]